MKELKFRAWDGRKMLRDGSLELHHFALAFDGGLVTATDAGFAYVGDMRVMQ